MRARKLRSRILTFVLPLALVPFVLMAVAVYYFVVRANNVQIEEEQTKLLSQALANVRKEQQEARKDTALIASLPASVDYLEALSRPAGEIESRKAAARTTLELFFNQHAYYLQLRLIDALGQERIKLSKLPGQEQPASIRGEEFFRRTLMYRAVQMPVEPIPPNHFASIFTQMVQRDRFYGMVAVDLNADVFQRSLRPLLATHNTATFLFDDRGVIFAKSLADAAQERCLQQINLEGEAGALLAASSLQVSYREISCGDRQYLFSVLPAEEFISFLEPVAGENWFLGVLRPKETLAQTRAFQGVFLVILAAAVGAVLWASARYSRRVTGPLEQMAAATSELARGKFDISLDIKTGDEVEELATAVTRMAEDLKKYRDELIKSAKLAAIGEMASEVSHEIQNRISGLSLWIQYLDGELPHDDHRREYLEEMKEGLRGFTQMLEELKQFYKTPVLHLRDTDANELVLESLRYVKPRIRERDVKVELELDPALPRITCDPDKTRSVILNLLINAVDAVDGGGHIRIQTRTDNKSDEESVIFCVTDSGCGIAEQDLPRIFYPFFSTKGSGSGLGLAIASNYVSAHGGKIGVESEVGEGTSFTVVLPVNRAGYSDSSTLEL